MPDVDTKNVGDLRDVEQAGQDILVAETTGASRHGARRRYRGRRVGRCPDEPVH